MTNRWDRSQTDNESESGLGNTLPGHRAGSPSLLTLMGPVPKSAAGVTRRHPSRPRVVAAPAVPRSTAFVQTIWSCTWPRPCAVAVAQPCPRTRAPNRWGPSSARPRFWPRAPLATRRPLPEEVPLKTTGGDRGLLSLGRSRLCRSFGLAHGLDRARLRRLARLALELGPKLLGPFKCALASGPRPLGDATRSSRGGAPQDGWRPRPAVSRSTAFVQAIWPCTWPRPCVAAAPQPPRLRTRNRAPNCWGLSNACQKEREGPRGGKVPGPGLALFEARTHVLLDACDPRPTNGQELLFLHRSRLALAAAAALAPAAPLPPGRSPRPSRHTRTHHAPLPPPRSPTAPQHTRNRTRTRRTPLPPRRPPRPPGHPTGHAVAPVLSHSRCSTTFSGIRGRCENSEPSLARATRNRHP
jgi:hypothetical protein